MNNLQFLLEKLGEECLEVAHIASKCKQFGLLEKHPDLDENNKQRLHAELNDLNAIVGMLNAQFDFSYTPDQKAMDKKVTKVLHFRSYSESLGLVSLHVPAAQYKDLDHGN